MDEVGVKPAVPETIVETDQGFRITRAVPRPYVLPEKAQIAGWVFLLFTALFLSLHGYDSFQVGVTQDDAEYAVLARSLVQSDRYGLINYPEAPGPTRYPFGYPLLLSPLVILFPNSPDALKLLSLAATLLNGALLFWGWRWFSPGTSAWWGLAVTGLYLLSPYTINQSRTVMTEPVFTTFCLLSFLLSQAGREKRPGPFICMALSASLLFAVFTKTAGAVLVLAILVAWFARWGKAAWKPVTAVSAGMLVLLAFILLATPVAIIDLLPSEYADQFTSPSGWGQNESEDSPGFRITRGVSEYLTQHIRQVILPLGGGEREQAFFTRWGLPFIPALFGLAISGVIALGFYRWIWTEPFSIPVLFALLFLGIMMVWPWRGPRFLYPIQPQLTLALLLGMAGILIPLARLITRRTFAAYILLSAFCLGWITLFAILSYPIDDSRLHTGDLQRRTAWLKEYTDSTAVIMTEQPKVDYLYGHRKTVPYGKESTPDQLEDYLSRYRVTYILIAPELEWKSVFQPSLSPESIYLLDLLQTGSPNRRFELVYSSEIDGISVFKVNP